jgi:hypothetical protein
VRRRFCILVVLLALLGTAMPVHPASAQDLRVVGALDSISLRANPATSPCPTCTLWSVTGWAASAATPGGELIVHMTVDGIGAGGQAVGGVPRPDVQAVHSYASATAGWRGLVAVPGDGRIHEICAVANGAGRNAWTRLGCATVTPGARDAGDPAGYVDEVRASSGRIHFRGWAGDPDEGAEVAGGEPTHVRLLLDGFWFDGFVAEAPRPDVPLVFPELRNAGGFAGSVPVPPGDHAWCLYALNSGNRGLSNTAIGCGRTTVPAADVWVFGALDRIHQNLPFDGPVDVSGWAWSPAAGSLDLRVDVLVVGEQMATSTIFDARTGGMRPDVATAHPVAGFDTGFSLSGDIDGRPAYACLFALVDGVEQFIGCRGATIG